MAFVNLAPRGEAALDGLTRRVLEGAARNVADDRRFAQTSVGWVLRELAKARPEDVRAFLADHAEDMSRGEARRVVTTVMREDLFATDDRVVVRVRFSATPATEL